MLIKDYRLLAFGCLGTLVDRDSGIATALRPLAARGGKDPRREDLLAAFARHEAAARHGGRHATLGDVLAEAHARLAREWGTTCSDGDHRLFARSIRDWPAFPDAAGALQYLKRYFRLALVSEVDRDTLRTMDRQLEAGFDLICAAPEHGAIEPDKRVFGALLSGAARLGVPPGRSLQIAARLDHDLAPAAESGLDCAWLDRQGRGLAEAADPGDTARRRFDYVFRSLADLVRTHQEQLRA